ncbi:MAG: hypothetical protein HZB99_02610 [Candidatus Harrisonbacteria bacterium]|nr:hypothetical protein [Candidatus Harrisonbacteria bacterium]
MKVDRRIIRTAKDIENLIWQKLIEEFFKAKSSKEIERLFNLFTTDQERETMARRMATISLIRKDVSYKEISRKLWVSPLTISAIKKSILGNGKYKSYHRSKKENIRKPKSGHFKIEASSFLDDWFNHIAFMFDNMPQKNGPRWKFLNKRRVL